MTDIFDPFSYLDPERAAKQIEAALGVSVFNKFSRLDPALWQKQIEAAAGKPIFDKFSVGDTSDELRQFQESQLSLPLPYHASAVHFDNTTPGSVFLLNNSFVVASGLSAMSYVVFFKTTIVDVSISPTIWASDPANAYAVFGGFGTSGNLFGLPVSEAGTADATKDIEATTTTSFGDGGWHSLVSAIDTQARQGKLYIDDVDVTNLLVNGASGFNFADMNALALYVGDDTFGNSFTGDMADLRIMAGTSLLDGGGDIPVATRRLFVSAGNKPVDPTIATMALGAPCMLFLGGASTFANNQGTGGAFTLTGSLTNASTSPSD